MDARRAAAPESVATRRGVNRDVHGTVDRRVRPNAPPGRSSPTWAIGVRRPPRRRRRLPARRGQVAPWWCGPPAHSPRRRAPLMIVAQTNEQVDDLIERLGRRASRAAVGRLSAADYVRADRVACAHCRTSRSARRLADLRQPPIVIGTAAKWATVTEGTLAVGDRRRGVPDALGHAAAHRRPVRAGAVRRRPRASSTRSPPSTPTAGSGLPWDPMQSAVAVLLRHNPDAAGAPAAGVLAAARLGRAGGRRGVLPVHRVQRRHRPRRRARLAFAHGRVRRRRSTRPSTMAAAHRLGPARAAGPPHHAHRRRGRRRVAASPAAAAAPRRPSRVSERHPDGRPVDRRPHRHRRRAPRPGGRDPRGAARPAVPRGSRSTPPTGCRAGSTT